MGSIVVERAGLYTSIQDAGRTGYRRFGIPVSGALDLTSLALANALVGNLPGSAALECRFLGPRIRMVEGQCVVAVVGADATCHVLRDGNKISIAPNRSVLLRADDVFDVGPLRNSSTAYLAISGGFDIAPCLGSLSTYAKAGMGGIDGAIITDGVALQLNTAAAPQLHETILTIAPDLTPPAAIRVILGPQDDYFTAPAIQTFLSAEWTVSQHADRMGQRLDGPMLEHSKGYNITSDGIVSGAIQVPGTGRPIILLADAQTSGGYPKIAAVISADLPAIGRMGPGHTLKFEAISGAEAVAIARQRQDEFNQMIEAIEIYKPVGEVDLNALYTENLISIYTEED
jgi:biotin-dependent carboxylase-like uncharacterized protein